MNWHYANAGQTAGPVSQEEFDNLVRAGTIKSDTLVWREGMANWQPYGTLSSSTETPGAPPISAPPPTMAAPSGFDAGGRAQAEQAVNGPAIGLMVTAGLGLLVTIASVIFNIVGVNMMRMNRGMDPETARLMQMFGGTVGIILSSILSLLMVGVVFYGAMQMRKLKNRGLAIGAAIVAMLPCICPSCFLGIPIGIWAIVVLNKPEVKQYFD